MSLLFNAAKKDMLRRIYRAKRREMSTDARREQDIELCRIISELPEFNAAETVLLYAPLGAETDVLFLAEIAKKRGKRLAFPLCNTKNKTMTFHYAENISDLEVGAYGIREPKADAEIYGGEPAVCILPGLAFDVYGNRLGYGGGYYDKYLAENSVFSIAPVRDGFLSDDALPVDGHDRKCDMIITLKGGVRISRE